jgi:hypothetical protein
MRGSIRRRGSTYTWYISVPDPMTGEPAAQQGRLSDQTGVRRPSTRRLHACVKAPSSGRHHVNSAPSWSTNGSPPCGHRGSGPPPGRATGWPSIVTSSLRSVAW